MTTEAMPLGAMIFLIVVLLIFAAMDMVMLVTLLRPGDERGQVVVWKASAWTLLAVVGTLILDVIENVVRGQYMSQSLCPAGGHCHHLLRSPGGYQEEARWLIWKTVSESGAVSWGSPRRSWPNAAACPDRR